MSHRVLNLPRVWQPVDAETVCTRIAIGPGEYREMTLTPEEAENYALDLLVDARRAKVRRAANQRLMKGTESPEAN